MAILGIFCVCIAIGCLLWRPVVCPVLRAVAEFLSRPLCEVLVLVVVVFGVVHYAGSKPDGGQSQMPPRSGEASHPRSLSEPEMEDVGDGEGFDSLPAVSNLTIAAILREIGITGIVVAWPPALRPEGDVVDVYGATNLHDFVKVKSVDVSGCASNALVAVSDVEVSGVATNTAEFLAVGDAADTDNDGVPDAEERFVRHTDPSLPDTDGDGLPDGEEVAMGTDPVSSDTDGDGLSDFREVLCVLPRSTLPWLEVSELANFTHEMLSEWRYCFSVGLPSPVLVQMETVTNVTFDVDGIFYFNRAGYSNQELTPSPRDMSMVAVDENCFAVAPYWGNVFFDGETTPSSVRFGTALHGGNAYYVLECTNMFSSLYGETNAISYQLSFPTGRVDRVFVRYKDCVGHLTDGTNVSIGMQSFGALTCVSYCYHEQGVVYDGMGLEFVLGYGTDPLRADTDGDGLSDGTEVDVFGVNPLSDDSDGDGMRDEWERQYQNEGFDPLVDNSTDTNPDNDGETDSDGDGLTNVQEATAGTSPSMPDSDGDGLSDGVEVLQGSNPNDRADTIPVKWVSVTGDLDMGVPKEVHETVTIPVGTFAFVGVFVLSDEYPDFTGYASEYNDRVSWDVIAAGNANLSGVAFVNNEDGAWDVALANGQFIDGDGPVVLKDGAVFVASGGSDLSVSVNLAAMNVSDGVLPSTVIVGVFPLKVVQSNMPTAVGVAGTTDGGTVYVREAIRTNGVAYITAHPTAPRLTAQFKGLPDWIGVAWSMALTTERGDKRFDGIDDRTLPQVSCSGTEVYDITSEMNGEVIGGACSLGIRVGTSSTIAFPFVIRGKNPLDATARAYITANVDAEFQSYAWMIAKHESMNAGGRVYNQFNAAGAQKEKPNWGSPHGWGVAQIDKGRNGDTTAEVYDWHANIAAMNATLREKRAEYRSFISMYRAVYANDASTQWHEPDGVTTNVNGVAVSAEMWGVLNCYNGKSGIPAMPLGNGTDMQSPLKFDPVTTNWVFYTNVNDYVPRVMADRNLLEQE